MIEIREERPDAAVSAVVISCPDAGGVDGVARCVDLALRLGHDRLVVDLGSRGTPDADLLSALHTSARRMRGVGGRLAVVCGDSRLRRLLDLTLLSQGFVVYATCEEALAG
jgi:hypothetical protein